MDSILFFYFPACEKSSKVNMLQFNRTQKRVLYYGFISIYSTKFKEIVKKFSSWFVIWNWKCMKSMNNYLLNVSPFSSILHNLKLCCHTCLSGLCCWCHFILCWLWINRSNCRFMCCSMSRTCRLISENITEIFKFKISFFYIFIESR